MHRLKIAVIQLISFVLKAIPQWGWRAITRHVDFMQYTAVSPY
jgi:hypothetical protein